MNLRQALARYLLFFGKNKIRYNALKSFTKTSWYETDLNKYLASFAKSSLDADKKKELQQNFCLRMSAREHRDPLFLPEPYKDACFTLALYKYDKLLVEEKQYEYLACIGFDTDVLRDYIVVKQIQGNQGKWKLLCLFKWERMLLAILTDWARKSGFSQIRVIQAKEQTFFKPISEEKTKRMLMHYDVTARRSGFAFNQSIGQYVKVVT